MEKIDNTNYDWFGQQIKQFSGDNVYKLPEDHNELMAMIMPRALVTTGNTDYTWLSNQAAYIDARAAQKIYQTLGIGDRYGFYIDGAHAHCGMLNAELPAMQSFVDKFLMGWNIATDVAVTPFPALDYQSWTWWWGTGNPSFPPGNNPILYGAGAGISSNQPVVSAQSQVCSASGL